MEHSEGFLNLVRDAKSQVSEIDLEQARERLAQNSNAQLIDVREDTEWANGHAAGARHLSRGIIERDIEREIPDKDRELILYCGGGFRSALVAESLQKIGYTNVHSMDGGWKAWKDSGAPISENEQE